MILALLMFQIESLCCPTLRLQQAVAAPPRCGYNMKTKTPCGHTMLWKTIALHRIVATIRCCCGVPTLWLPPLRPHRAGATPSCGCTTMCLNHIVRHWRHDTVNTLRCYTTFRLHHAGAAPRCGCTTPHHAVATPRRVYTTLRLHCDVVTPRC